uniref:Microtubule-associated protein 1A-like n=1 Tax=Nothobranchius furzeri TaxID=105023 RepID=A0A8C6LUI9_NOTFU
MKPDGVTMETAEPNEAAALAEPSSLQENVTREVPSQPDVATEAAPVATVKPLAAEPKVKPKTGGGKTQSTASAGASGATSRPGTSHRTGNDVKSSAAAPGGKKTATTLKASAAGAVPKRPVGGAAALVTAKTQTKVLDKRPAGPARTTSVPSATVSNSTRLKTMDGSSKRPEAGNGARPKTTANRTVTSTAPKQSSTTATKPGTASTKTTRSAAGPPASRMAATTSKTTAATAKSSTTAKPAASTAARAPPTGRNPAAQLPKTAASKKDVGRPPSAAAAAAKKPSAASASLATKTLEPSKPATATKLNSVPKGSKIKPVDAKATQSKPVQPAKKPVVGVRLPTNRAAQGKTPPASPAGKPLVGSSPITKRHTKPTQTVQPFSASKKTGSTNVPLSAVQAQDAPSPVTAAAAAEVTVALEEEPSLPASAVEDVPSHPSTQHSTEEDPQAVPHSSEDAPSPYQSTATAPVPQTSPGTEPSDGGAPSTTKEQVSSPASPLSPPVAPLPPPPPPPQVPEDNGYLLTERTPSKAAALPAAASAIPQPVNLNEEEEEEEREGSQLVSVSEMSGTTQPTEESRPGSGGPLGGSAWRAGGALLSELDSEEVSQQGASELSAPGVLEGTESTDDLGDGSLKGAIDMEGASAGSPDFEKVPDIPANDFDDDEDEDDSDRVCDMDVGSERTDEPHRPRHDNDVDKEEEDDDDVEMASEGVTESGLESYGNADEDDFAEVERLDNLNRVDQPPPPPPLLPSAPAAQWDQPNPFVDPWAEPPQPQQVLEAPQVAGAAPERLQADPESPAQVRYEHGSAEKQDTPHHSPVTSEPQNIEVQLNMDPSHQAPVESSAVPSAPRTSLSNTLSSETSTPEDQGEKHQSPAAQALMHSPDYQGLDLHLERADDDDEEEADPETLPADEVLEGPATVPTSNPTSSSVTEDEASDMEGEAQLDPSEDPIILSQTFDGLLPPQRSLSTVEEREEAEMEEVEGGAGDEATPPSATSLASYGLDSITTASSSNAQSTGESCIKSPGVFSLEELSQEAKEPGFAQQCDTGQLYIECEKQEKVDAEQKVSTSEEVFGPSSAVSSVQPPEEIPDDIQPPYYSAVCEKAEESSAGFTALPHPHRCDHSAYPRIYCDVVKPHSPAAAVHKLSCADLPPRSPGQQARSPQLRRLEQHQRQLLELQQRREQQSRPLEEAEQERKSRAEREERRRKEEAEEEIKRNEQKEKEAEEKRKCEERKQRRDLELQLLQQQLELKQRQQIMQWQQELQQPDKGQTASLSPSSSSLGLCTIYEALENGDEEAEDLPAAQDQTIMNDSSHRMSGSGERAKPHEHRDSAHSTNNSPQDEDKSALPPKSPERPPPLDLDWGKKVDIIQQLINQTLLLNGDDCSSLLLVPGGAGGTLSPLESSLWPSLLPPLTPPSATVTSVSSFSPEPTGSSSQGEWTVVELETHH